MSYRDKERTVYHGTFCIHSSLRSINNLKCSTTSFLQIPCIMIHHICVFHFQIVKVNGFVFLKEGPRVPRPSLEFDETVARNSECFNIVATGLFVCRCNSHEPFLPLQRSKALRTPDMPCYPVHCCQTVPSRQTHNVEPGSASFFELKLCVVVIEQLPINLCTTNLPKWTKGILCQVLCLDRPGLHKTGHPVVVVVAGGFRQETCRCHCHRQCLSRSQPETHTHICSLRHTHTDTRTSKRKHFHAHKRAESPIVSHGKNLFSSPSSSFSRSLPQFGIFTSCGVRSSIHTSLYIYQ